MKHINYPPLYLLLASMSSYRADCLAKVQVQFNQWAPHIDETPLPDEAPVTMVERLALAKATAALAMLDATPTQPPYTHIIASDQTLMVGQQRLGKPMNKSIAQAQLQQMSGKTITFLTSLCVLNLSNSKSYLAVDTTFVKLRTLTANQIERYLDIDQPYDCAGSFKSERAGIALCESIRGKDPNALIGLPMICLTDLLLQTGYALL